MNKHVQIIKSNYNQAPHQQQVLKSASLKTDPLSFAKLQPLVQQMKQTVIEGSKTAAPQQPVQANPVSHNVWMYFLHLMVFLAKELTGFCCNVNLLVYSERGLFSCTPQGSLAELRLSNSGFRWLETQLLPHIYNSLWVLYFLQSN